MRFGIAAGTWTINAESVCEFNVGMSFSGCCRSNKDLLSWPLPTPFYTSLSVESEFFLTLSTENSLQC